MTIKMKNKMFTLLKKKKTQQQQKYNFTLSLSFLGNLCIIVYLCTCIYILLINKIFFKDLTLECAF